MNHTQPEHQSEEIPQSLPNEPVKDEAEAEADKAMDAMSNEDQARDIQALSAKVTEWEDKFTRLYSEFDNYRRRTAREKLDATKFAGEDFMKAVLPVLDDFERGLRSMETLQDTAALKEGVNLIFQKFRSILVQKGLEEMSSMHQVFDPELHEAITQVPAQAEEMKGKVIDEVEKGYALNGKVIRYAKVVVGS
jgi:molecular chaperone GrpE